MLWATKEVDEGSFVPGTILAEAGAGSNLFTQEFDSRAQRLSSGYQPKPVTVVGELLAKRPRQRNLIEAESPRGNDMAPRKAEI